MITYRHGRNTPYVLLHEWVRKTLGTPSLCSECGTTEQRMYHWANISQEYKKDVTDWRRLCVPCHFREKHPGECIQGHKMTPENTYIAPSAPNDHMCLTCKRLWRKRQWQKEKARRLQEAK